MSQLARMTHLWLPLAARPQSVCHKQSACSTTGTLLGSKQSYSPRHLFLGDTLECSWYAQTGRLLEANGKTLPPGFTCPSLGNSFGLPNLCPSRTTQTCMWFMHCKHPDSFWHFLFLMPWWVVRVSLVWSTCILDQVLSQRGCSGDTFLSLWN